MSETALAKGTLIEGRYRLEEHLGEGGMGTVWSALHTVTRRSVAMKFLKDSGNHKPELRQRFLREASAASALSHPNVVEILDVFGFDDQAPVMVMELLEGETLGKKLARDERLSMEETAALILPVVSAVGTAHALGIVHRDLKPENLFLQKQDGEITVKVLDFGIAKLTAEVYLERGLSALLTDTGSMLGTPCYMAPEQATGEGTVDHRADIWSLGVILYECLSGTRPIEGDNLPQVVTRLVSAGIIPLEKIAPELPHEVTAIVTQMLSRDPARRPQDLHEVSKVLSRYSHVKAPDFGVPSTHGAVEPEAPKKAKVVSNRDADPQGATLLSTPAVVGSVRITAESVRKRRRLIGAVLGAAAFLVIGVSILNFFRSAEPAAAPSTSATASSDASSQAAVPPSAAEVTSAVPSAATSAAPKASAPTKIRPRPASAPRPKAASASRSKPPADDETLFSGRK